MPLSRTLYITLIEKFIFCCVHTCIFSLILVLVWHKIAGCNKKKLVYKLLGKLCGIKIFSYIIRMETGLQLRKFVFQTEEIL